MSHVACRAHPQLCRVGASVSPSASTCCRLRQTKMANPQQISSRSMLPLVLTTFLLGAAVISADYTPEALADEVKNLPGTEKLDLNFRQFSGYLPVTATKNLHYWFAESQNNPATGPVAFWTN
eukprot:gene16600-19649_t